MASTSDGPSGLDHAIQLRPDNKTAAGNESRVVTLRSTRRNVKPAVEATCLVCAKLSVKRAPRTRVVPRVPVHKRRAAEVIRCVLRTRPTAARMRGGSEHNGPEDGHSYMAATIQNISSVTAAATH